MPLGGLPLVSIRSIEPGRRCLLLLGNPSGLSPCGTSSQILESTATASLPLSSPLGIVSTFGTGQLFGYLYEVGENIAAPQMAHAVAGLALVMIGRMVFVPHVPRRTGGSNSVNPPLISN